jgi:Zn-dependent protease with chaperone function
MKGHAAQRAARLFWSVLGSCVLIVSGVLAVWFVGGRHGPPLPSLDACMATVWQVWAMTHWQAVTSPFTSFVALVLGASGAWAGVRTLRAWCRTRRFLAHSEPYRRAYWPALDAALVPLPHCQQRLRTLATSRPVACTVGLWRHHIVLSTGLLATLSTAEIQAVVSHEWGHVSRRDPLRLLLLRWCSQTLWFLPIVRAMARDSARAMEEAADDLAVGLMDQPLELAAALVKIAQAQAVPSRSAIAAHAEDCVVTERVERLLALASTRPRPPHTWAWVTSGLVALGLFGLLVLPRQVSSAAASMSLSSAQPQSMHCALESQMGS